MPTYREDRIESSLIYDIVIFTKYHKPLFTPDRIAYVEDSLYKTIMHAGVKLIMLNIEPDNIHLCVELQPTDIPNLFVNKIKNAINRSYRRNFPDAVYKTMPFWSSSYMIKTYGPSPITEDEIARFSATIKHNELCENGEYRS